MNILVIGNGFDLEHGLPTKYKDFLDFIQGVNLLLENTGPISKDSLVEKVGHKVDHNIKKYLFDEKHSSSESWMKWMQEGLAKELIECANNNIWIKYFIENMYYEKEGWIDLESEISNVIKCFEYFKDISKLYKQNNNTFTTDIDRYKETIVKKIIEYSGFQIQVFELVDKQLECMINVLDEHLNGLIRCLEIYLDDCVGKINVEYIAPDIKDIKLDKVLSFNYTNTYERIYGFNNNDIEYHYIHGKADITCTADDNNMVLGIDEYLDDEAKNKELEFISFKKYFQRIYKKTGNTYKKWIEEIEEDYKMIFTKVEKYREILYKQKSEAYINKYKDNINNLHSNKNKIYILGHSLDVTDKDIIKELIECENTETTIFYYNKEVYAQQIANLVKVIGQDELIKRVSGANPTIIFKQQQERIQLD